MAKMPAIAFELLRSITARAPQVLDGPLRVVSSPDYTYIFNAIHGIFARCGKTLNDDPQRSPIGPEIADIEVSTICHGINNIPCPHCYKSNSGSGVNMSLGTFKTVFAKLPPSITQIAFGIGDLDANPDLLAILHFCRDNPHKRLVVPNITINGTSITQEWIQNLAHVCGAIAVSRYSPTDICYEAVRLLTAEFGKPGVTLRQVNIHQLLAEETYNDCLEVINDVRTDPRLKKVNAVVFLALKPKGRGKTLHSLTDFEKYRSLVTDALSHGTPIGFDSCSAQAFLRAISDRPDATNLAELVEPCESMLFSCYCNVYGEVFPCSFAEGEGDWQQGISLMDANNFINDIWNHPRVAEWCRCLFASRRGCPIFKILAS
jgi:MoaA/NifB/PqqE/SkfB family radical SAM enzyme